MVGEGVWVDWVVVVVNVYFELLCYFEIDFVVLIVVYCVVCEGGL